MVVYVPGTLETDPKKVIMSLQQIGPGLDTANTNIATNTTNIATNTTNIATNTTNIASNTNAITALQAPNYGLVNSSGSLGVSLSKITATLGANVSLNNISNYFDGPSIAQGSSGTWFVSGTVTLKDTAGAGTFSAKLWDGTTLIASAQANTPAASAPIAISLSGYITSPAANLRISVRDSASTSGFILFNQTGLSMDSTISAIRIA